MNKIQLPPEERVRQVVATMAIENMNLKEDFIQELLKVANHEKTSEELLNEVIAKYV